MLEEISELIGLQVYTHEGMYLGNVSNLIIDVANSKIDSLFITDTNPLLIQDSRNISVPFRWIQSIGDIVILQFFPKKVTIKRPSESPTLDQVID